jgi:hypothetical protein
MKQLILTFLIFSGGLARALTATDVTIREGKILFQSKVLHPGCFRELSTELNGDALTMVVNIAFEKPNGEFIGRGCMTANKYFQPAFTKNGYLAYAEDKDAVKKLSKDPLLRFDGFGYKLAKKIDDKTFAVDVREFTTGSEDFLKTVLVQVVEESVIEITPDRKSISAKVISLRKIGEILNGTVNWQEKLQDAMKTWQKMEKDVKKKGEVI